MSRYPLLVRNFTQLVPLGCWHRVHRIKRLEYQDMVVCLVSVFGSLVRLWLAQVLLHLTVWLLAILAFVSLTLSLACSSLLNCFSWFKVVGLLPTFCCRMALMRLLRSSSVVLQ